MESPRAQGPATQPSQAPCDLGRISAPHPRADTPRATRRCSHYCESPEPGQPEAPLTTPHRSKQGGGGGGRGRTQGGVQMGAKRPPPPTAPQGGDPLGSGVGAQQWLERELSIKKLPPLVIPACSPHPCVPYHDKGTVRLTPGHLGRRSWPELALVHPALCSP